jgi:hypothetical protein
MRDVLYDVQVVSNNDQGQGPGDLYLRPRVLLLQSLVILRSIVLRSFES